MRFGLSDFFFAKTVSQPLQARLLRSQIGFGLGPAVSEIKGFQTDQRSTRLDRLSFLAEYLGHAASQVRTQSDFIRFDETGYLQEVRRRLDSTPEASADPAQ